MQIGQVAVSLVEIEAVADEELVRDGEADVADRQILDEPPVRPVEERGGCERAGLPEAQRPEEVVEREAGVDDVVDQQDVAPADVEIEVLQQADAVLAARIGAPVACELEEVDPVHDRDRPREVGEEDEAGLEQADQDGLSAGVVLGDLPAELGDASRDLLGAEVDGADSLVALQDARSRLYRSASRSMSRL